MDRPDAVVILDRIHNYFPAHIMVHEIIGEGTYGTVFSATNLAKDRAIALKKCKYEKGKNGLPGNFIRECSILQ
jgi:serine/threonine protein kinase